MTTTNRPPIHEPRRGSDVETWIKRHRDEYDRDDPQTCDEWEALDGLLDDYRDHAATGVELDDTEQGQADAAFIAPTRRLTPPANPKESPMTTTTDPFAAAERLAPVPDSREQATRDNWIRHYAALALAAHVAFRRAIHNLPSNLEAGSRPDLGHLVALAVASTTAAVALHDDTDTVGELIWDLTPEAGALNGEWADWLDETLVAHGINPGDIDPDLDPADFAADVAANA